MWNYERRLEYPVNISRCNPQAAMIIMSQYGGPYSIRYKFTLEPRFLHYTPLPDHPK